MQEMLGCSGWDYPDPPEKGGWLGVFYPSRKTKRLRYYSGCFETAEMDSTFYAKLYSKMTKGTFMGLVKATPEKFQFSLKIPETITHHKKLGIERGAITELEEFLEKISPLKNAEKLGALLIQLPPSFAVERFRNTEEFLDRLPGGYDYAVEFRHPSWRTEGPWEMLKQYNIAAVITDSPEEELGFLSEVTLTADHAFIRWHGRNPEFWYNYLYRKDELEPWVGKVEQIRGEAAERLRGYFNNHWAGKAVLNALQFKEMTGTLSESERRAMEHAERYLSLGGVGIERWM